VKSFASTSIGYDFTTSAAQAYGSNQKLLSNGKYGICGGDVYRDTNPGIVNFYDYSDVLDNVRAGAYGYLKTDVNGDGIVNFFDLSLVIDNVRGGVFTSVTPTNP
jgi:hypothetical protein